MEDCLRRLAAIMATDVVGYSRNVAEDETGTLNATYPFRDPAHTAMFCERLRKAGWPGL
jgi:hypothetical protein